MYDKEIKWRFKGNNYTSETGLDTSDMETFKRDPLASLARESCQNSIDARSGEHNVFIEFHPFEINKEEIPGRFRIEVEMQSCKEYQKDNKKIVDALSKMIKEINKEKIECLRISDSYTRGLVGVSSNEQKSFYLLTKGSGLTNKIGSSGGSKGIGKYASFVASSFNTVFYSTFSVENEMGYIGICKLCSTTMPNTDERTQGIGYYGLNEKNEPILTQLKLDKNFERTIPGTDIYILGFKKEDGWKKEIITKILDSFMCAIQFGDLEVKVDEIIINQENLSAIVDSDEYILDNSKNNIKSQYILLTDQSVYKHDIAIGDYGNATLYLKEFKKEESYLATNECVMVRFPYMKIKSFKNISSVPCSAMCVINDNTLNRMLRDIENPQHTDWEIKRIEDVAIRDEVKGVIRELRNQIGDFVYEALSFSENKEIDVEGASDFLPEFDGPEGVGNSSEVIISETPKIAKRVKNKVKDKIGITVDEEGNALQPDLGLHEPGEGSPVPEGHNYGEGGGVHDSENEQGFNTEGDNEIMKLVQLSGIKYRFFVVDKNSGKYVISFISPYEENNCGLQIYYLDDSGAKYKMNIIKCNINGIVGKVSDGGIIEIQLNSNKKYKIELNADLKGLYACEVKMYAHR
jgi:hypothetical protein